MQVWAVYKQILFRVLTVALVLGAFEIAFRVFVRLPMPRLCQTGEHVDVWCQPLDRLVANPGWWSPPAHTVYEHIYPDDPRGYFKPGGRVEYRLNAEGFRGPDLTDARPCVIFLGDSFTFGEGVHWQDTFVARLQRSWQKTAKSIQVANLAQPGINTYSERKILERYLPRAKAQLAVLVVTPNDWPSNLVAQVHGATIRGRYTSLFEESTLYHCSRMLWWFAARWEQIRLDGTVSAWFDEMQTALPAGSLTQDEFRDNLVRIKDLAASHDCDLAIVVLPELIRLSPSRYPYRFIHEAVAGIGKAEGVQVIDLLEDFMGNDPASLWVHAVDHHPNEKAHEMIAGRIARELDASIERLANP